MTRRPIFWAAFALLAAAAGTFAFLYADRAFPVADLDLEMGRAEALTFARELAERHGWGPEGFRQAASFTDPSPEARTYAELEAGAEDPLAALQEAGGYHAYRWQVRHFEAGETKTLLVSFTPAGDPYAFNLRLPEDEPGARLDPEAARRRVERELPAWGIDPERYELLESAQETLPGDRIDHTFVYRLRDTGLAEGEFRLHTRIAGDRVAEVRPYVHVPEEFTRRYAEMRSANERLGVGATAVFVLLFLAGGCGVGGFLLLRERRLLWRPALAWGLAVAALVGLALVSYLPLTWMDYDTAVPEGVFLLGHVALAVGALVVLGPLFALIFSVAEGLGRKAFPEGPQQWRLWARGVANTRSALGRTLAGYLLALWSLGYVVAFYLVAGRWEGWWIPAEALVQPDLLATYAPWLSAVALSLQAGFWEESLFRAVPLAGAALLGARFGARRWWIGGALVLQALVFGAAHADYPAQPYFARLVELFPEALLWGLVYLGFGLVPVILSHFLYNLTLSSVPLFASDASGIWMHQAMVVAVGLAPLAWVLVRTVRHGLASDLPEEARNRSWRPAPAEAPSPPEEAPAAPAPAAGPRWVWGLAAVFVAGAALWGVLTPWEAPVPPLSPERNDALEVARREQAARGLDEEAEGWKVLAAAEGASSQAHRFVWQEGGEEPFEALLGTYLEPPHWELRVARFTGPVEERAEELTVGLDREGDVASFHHALPEAREGASLEEEEARGLARRALEEAYGLGEADAPEVSAEATQRPERRDWSFVFSDPASYPLDEGDARIRIDVAGERIAGRERFVRVPEQWERRERAEQARRRIFRGTDLILTVLVFAAAAVAGVVRWARSRPDRRGDRRFPGRLTLALAGGLLVVTAVSIWNTFPVVAFLFQTAVPFDQQALAYGLVMAIVVPFTAIPLALAVGFAHSWRPRRERPAIPPAAAGAALGVGLAGLVALARALLPALLPAELPMLPGLNGADAFMPTLAVALGSVIPFTVATSLLLLALVAVERVGRRPRGLLLGALVALAAGFLFAGTGLPGGIWVWAGATVAAGAGVLLLARLERRLHPALVPALVGAPFVLEQIRLLVQDPFPGARAGAAAGAVLIAALALLWSRTLHRPVTANATATPAPPEPAPRHPPPG